MDNIVEILLAIWVILFSWRIKLLEDEIERIKSWHPFCELLKIKIPEKDDFEFNDKE